MRFIPRAILSLCLSAAAISPQPARGQQGRTKIIRTEVGYSSTHDGSDTGISGAVHFAISSRGGGPFRFEVGAIAGNPYVGLDGGVEARFPSRGALGALLRAGTGLLLEDGFTGVYVRGGGGLEWELSPRVALRGTWQAGYHGSRSGPHLLHFGVDYRR